MEIDAKLTLYDAEPFSIVRIIQLRHERCSANHIASVLNLNEAAVIAVLKDDQKFIDEFLGGSNQNDKPRIGRISNAEFLSLRLKKIVFKGRKRQVEDCNKRNFLEERLREIPNYSKNFSSIFFFKKDLKYAYEIAFINQFRVYHLVRLKPDSNFLGFTAQKCFQLIYEGFSADAVDEIFDAKYTKGLDDFAKHMDSKLDRRNTNILNHRVQIPQSSSKITYAESLHLSNQLTSNANESFNDFDFYMNINNGMGKVKSIRSITKIKK